MNIKIPKLNTKKTNEDVFNSFSSSKSIKQVRTIKENDNIKSRESEDFLNEELNLISPKKYRPKIKKKLKKRSKSKFIKIKIHKIPTNFSDIICTSILNKILSFVNTEINKINLNKKICFYSFDFLKNNIDSLIEINKLSFESKQIQMFFNNNIKKIDVFNEILEPNPPEKERSMISNFKARKFEKINNNLILNKYSIKEKKSEKNIKIEKKKNVNKISSNKLKKNNINYNNNKFDNNFLSFDIPKEKLFNINDSEENKILRENYEKEFIKNKIQILPQKKNINKNIKNKRIIKKKFNSKNFTFDSNGIVIPLKKFNLNNINNNIVIKTTVHTKEIIKDKHNFTENFNVKIIENNLNNNNKNLKNIELHNYKINKLKIISGSSFNLIKPEFGVVITENNKTKNGMVEYLKKYKKNVLTEINAENNNNNKNINKNINKDFNNNNNNIFKNVKKMNIQKNNNINKNKILTIHDYNKIIVKSKSFQNIIKNDINEEKILKINNSNKNINNNKNNIKYNLNNEKFKIINDFNKAIVEKNFINLEKIPPLPNLKFKHLNNENKKLILKYKLNHNDKNLRERKKNLSFNNINENNNKNLLKLLKKRSNSEKIIKKQE